MFGRDLVDINLRSGKQGLGQSCIVSMCRGGKCWQSVMKFINYNRLALNYEQFVTTNPNAALDFALTFRSSLAKKRSSISG